MLGFPKRSITLNIITWNCWIIPDNSKLSWMCASFERFNQQWHLNPRLNHSIDAALGWFFKSKWYYKSKETSRKNFEVWKYFEIRQSSENQICLLHQEREKNIIKMERHLLDFLYHFDEKMVSISSFKYTNSVFCLLGNIFGFTLLRKK